jgi:DNA-binding Lrp family transcriptional regulator
MNKAIVLITLEAGAEQLVLEQLREMEGIIDAHFLYGPYDAFVKIKAEDSQQLHNIVINKIRSIEGVLTTMTCFIAD